VIVVSLIEEDVLPVLNSVIIGGKILEDPAGTNSVLSAELLPELCTD
jgi:hypothetical protein